MVLGVVVGVGKCFSVRVFLVVVCRLLLWFVGCLWLWFVWCLLLFVVVVVVRVGGVVIGLDQNFALFFSPSLLVFSLNLAGASHDNQRTPNVHI